VSHHQTQCHIIIHSVTSSYTVPHHHTQCHIIKHSVISSYGVTSSYTVSHHQTQCHFIKHSVTSSYTVSHHQTQCHIIIHSVTSSNTVSHHHIIHRVTSSNTVSHHQTQCHIIIHSVTSPNTVHSARGNPWSHVTGEKWSKIPIAPVLKRHVLPPDKNGNFGSVNIKFETGTRIQSLDHCTWRSATCAKYVSSCLLFAWFQKRPATDYSRLECCVTSPYIVSHHQTQCHIIIHSVTSSSTVSHQQTLSHHHT